MAAKQGLSAQISQASEDAKRGFLQRTSLTNSLWFSNLNTTCTIKSAPPRTPDVLGMLSVKSGWLFKRNEQHVWQARYCCVVPHTFLYYFDSHPSNPCQTPQITSKQQEELNKIVRQGFGKRGQSQPRSSLYNVLSGSGGGGGNSQTPLPPDETAAEASHDDNVAASSISTTVQPAGIIDMECYTTIHRNSQNELVMELAGDETVNPDLRSFYFCANTDQEGEEWTQALLGQRHSSLTDEREAYKQVCDGFAQQLQVLHTELDQAQRQADNQQDELYRVRSGMEDTRRNTLRLVSEIMSESTRDQREDTINSNVPAKKAYKTDLETIHAQDLGILPAVQLLCDYTRVLEETCSDNKQKVSKLEEKLVSKQKVDTSKVEELEQEILRLKEENTKHISTMESQVETLTQKLVQSKKECQDVQKDLASQRMEMTMYQSSTRTKLGELQSHKKILKKEVIELRNKTDEINIELDRHRRRESSVKHKVEQERQKSKLLERYVDKIESQVKVQQNMMEMMSQAGSVYGGSLYGGTRAGGSEFGTPPSTSPPTVVRAKSNNPISRSVDNNYNNSSRTLKYDNIIVNTGSKCSDDKDVVVDHDDDDDDDDGDDDDDDDDENDYAQEANIPDNHLTRARRRGRRNMDDVDDKSHMSELTEERTQKQFDAAMLLYSSNPQLRAAIAGSPRMGPPAIIGIAEESPIEQQSDSTASGEKLDTIMSTSRPSSTRRLRGASSIGRDLPTTLTPAESPSKMLGRKNNDSSESISSMTKSKSMTVAQKARLDADRQSTPVRIRLNQIPLRGNNSGNTVNERKQQDSSSVSSSNRSNGFFSKLGKRFENALDNSVLGVESSDDDDSSDEENSGYFAKDVRNRSDPRSIQDEKKMEDNASEASTNVSLSLVERQALQRAHQLQFLKEQGLINKESEVKGGAGGDTNSVCSRSSRRRQSARVKSL